MLTRGLVMLAAALLFAAPASAAPPTTLTETEHALLAAVNSARTTRGLPPLRLNHDLTRSARLHSRWLLTQGRLVHRDLSRLAAGLGAIGENLAWGAGVHGRAASIEARWLTSPSHRANLLRPGFRWIGLGAATGTFAGRAEATVVTAVFAA
jgi:uncharacterized protein YkwD